MVAISILQALAREFCGYCGAREAAGRCAAAGVGAEVVAPAERAPEVSARFLSEYRRHRKKTTATRAAAAIHRIGFVSPKNGVGAGAGAGVAGARAGSGSGGSEGEGDGVGDAPCGVVPGMTSGIGCGGDGAKPPCCACEVASWDTSCGVTPVLAILLPWLPKNVVGSIIPAAAPPGPATAAFGDVYELYPSPPFPPEVESDDAPGVEDPAVPNR